ncbi:receptor-like serine/threonine-protein kinase SD1-7 isoform X2 [Phragmites australis]|uniref:receptor-like serine/threonine-protein kinase SD1-7 isoform X2 n=1 Tax=Phragmites australis TaxID=29695 RepID=UPI002D7699BF|nr:receptor-like serine/threonine-protein kinase SD1-7 isoform X2 [Phragmites australis]
MGNKRSKHSSRMMAQFTDFGVLEKMLQDPCATPMCLPLDFLKAITLDFSEERQLGGGGFGVVYKGVFESGKAIAVKRLREMYIGHDQFENEVTYLIELKHQNIIQLKGYCAESRWEASKVRDQKGKYVMTQKGERLLCFEYLHNDESSGLEWHMRYEMIRGICCGLHYLHEDCNIVHLDLKPENILLDDNMIPKIADFGMSRLFGERQTRIFTEAPAGTPGYMAPEYLIDGLISKKADMFSLGIIIIKLMTGSRDYPQRNDEASLDQFVQNVVGNWSNRMKNIPRYIPLKVYTHQVYTCIMTGLRCVNHDSNKRPTVSDVIEELS